MSAPYTVTYGDRAGLGRTRWTYVAIEDAATRAHALSEQGRVPYVWGAGADDSGDGLNDEEREALDDARGALSRGERPAVSR